MLDCDDKRTFSFIRSLPINVSFLCECLPMANTYALLVEVDYVT